MKPSKGLRDGARIEPLIFARVTADGRITAFQVKVTAPGGTRIAESFERIEEARSYRDSLRADLALDPYKERVLRAREEAERKRKLAGILVADVLRDYLAKGLQHHKAAKSTGYMVVRLQSMAIAKVPILALARKHITSLADGLGATGIKPITVNKYLSCLSAALKWAREALDYELPNPVLDLPTKLRRTIASKARTRRLVGEEERYLRAALAASRNAEVSALFELALETGARQGELLALKARNVDAARCLALAEDTKNGTSRYLLLSPRALEVIAELRAAPVKPLDGRLVRMRKSNLANIWARAKGRARRAYVADCKRCRVEPDPAMFKDLRWHDLRREAISTVAESRALVGERELQKFSGHLDTRMLSVYVNMQNEQQLAAQLAAMPRRGGAR